MKFNRKQIVVDAVQMTQDVIDNRSVWPTWLIDAWYKPDLTPGAVWLDKDKKGGRFLMVMADQYYSFAKGEEAGIIVNPGDWIVHKGNGVLGLYQNNVFVEEYEKAD